MKRQSNILQLKLLNATVYSTQNVSQLIKRDCKRVEPCRRLYMQKLTNFTVSKHDITKFLWGRLGGIDPTTFWPWGRSPPSPPWSRRLCFTKHRHTLLPVQVSDSYRCNVYIMEWATPSLTVWFVAYFLVFAFLFLYFRSRFHVIRETTQNYNRIRL